jgi:glycosyltransferase involved in cell wall biosynthesis
MPKKKIKIVHIIPTLDMGGAERLLVDIVKNLDKDTFSVSVVCLKRFGSWGIELKKQGIVLSLAGGGKHFGFFNFLNLLKILKEAKPDIVHTHLFGADVFGVLAAKLVGTKAIVSTEHNLNYQEGTLKRFVKNKTMTFVQKIVAVSEAVKKYVVLSENISEDKVTVIFNGVELEKFLNKERKYPKKNEVIIGSLGRLTEQKGFDFLVKSMTLLKDEKVRCLVAGEGKNREKLEKQIEKESLTNKIKFLGWQQDTKKFLSLLDIFILPSRWEGFGIAILEAGLSGLPVIASKVDGIKEIIEDGVDGLLFEKGDFNELAEKISYLVGNPKERERLGSSLQNKVKERFFIEKIVKEYEKLYLRLLK